MHGADITEKQGRSDLSHYGLVNVPSQISTLMSTIFRDWPFYNMKVTYPFEALLSMNFSRPKRSGAENKKPLPKYGGGEEVSEVQGHISFLVFHIVDFRFHYVFNLHTQISTNQQRKPINLQSIIMFPRINTNKDIP